MPPHDRRRDEGRGGPRTRRRRPPIGARAGGVTSSATRWRLAPVLAVVLALGLTPSRAWTGPASSRGLVQIDRAVAVVGDQVITASDVRIAQILAQLDQGGLPLLAPPEGSEDDVERWWIQQVMLRQLAGDVEVYQPSPGELRERLRALVDRLGDSQRWTTLQVRLGLDRAGVEAWTRNRLVVERFVLRNVGALGRHGEVGEVDPDRFAAWLDQVRGSVSVRRIRPLVETP